MVKTPQRGRLFLPEEFSLQRCLVKHKKFRHSRRSLALMVGQLCNHPTGSGETTTLGKTVDRRSMATTIAEEEEVVVGMMIGGGDMVEGGITGVTIERTELALRSGIAAHACVKTIPKNSILTP